MKEKIIELLQEIRSDVDVESTSLIDDGDLESLDIVALVGALNDEFDVDITVEHLIPENFNSIDAMAALIQELSE